MPDSQTAIPDDDSSRTLTVARRDAPEATHLSLAGDTYTLLITGEQTRGRYCLIDMQVPDQGGPPRHRHDFEEMFTILEGQVDFTFRGQTTTAHAGTTVNIPANAPHFFRNTSGRPARMLCLCSPAGQDEYFLEVGDLVDGPTSAPPPLTEEQQQQRRQKASTLATQYRTEMMP